MVARISANLNLAVDESRSDWSAPLRGEIVNLAAAMDRGLERLRRDPTDPGALEQLLTTGRSMVVAAGRAQLEALLRCSEALDRSATLGATPALTPGQVRKTRELFDRMQDAVGTVQQLLEWCFEAGNADQQGRSFRELCCLLADITAVEEAVETQPIRPSTTGGLSGLRTDRLLDTIVDDELLSVFAVEAAETFPRCAALLEKLEAAPSDRDLLFGLLREFHTLKGASAAVGLDAVVRYLHHGESLIEAGMRTESRSDGLRRVETLIQIMDAVKRLVGQAGSPVGRSEVRPPRLRQSTALECVFRRLARAASQAARQERKRVEVSVRGGELRLDRRLAEGLHAPLLHLVRNAVAHGIEAPHVRVAHGKPRAGTIRITATSAGSCLMIAVEDDGAGLHFDRILAQARRLQLVDAHTTPTRKELLNLILRPGFSTTEGVSTLAGRGVGLHTVTHHLEALGGRIEVDSTRGGGTAFRLYVPLPAAPSSVEMAETGAHDHAVAVSQ